MGANELRERRAGWSEQRMNWCQCLEVVIYEGERGIRMEPVGYSRNGTASHDRLEYPFAPPPPHHVNYGSNSIVLCTWKLVFFVAQI